MILKNKKNVLIKSTQLSFSKGKLYTKQYDLAPLVSLSILMWDLKTQKWRPKPKEGAPKDEFQVTCFKWCET